MDLRELNPKPSVADLAAASHREQRIFYLMFRAGLSVRALLEDAGKGEGVTLSQYTLLSLIAARDDLTTASLARRLEISPQSVNEMLRTLHLSGFISKIASKSDRRLQFLSLTDKGLEQLEKAEDAMDRAEAIAFAGFSPKARREFVGMLKSIIERHGESQL